MCRSRILVVAFVLVAFRIAAHERPVVNTAVVIKSGTIGERLEANPVRREAAVRSAQRIIAQSIAAELNEVFSFVQWKPEHRPGAAVAALTVVVTQSTDNYVLSYARSVSGERGAKGAVDWGKADPLFKSSDERPLGNPVLLGAKIATKVAEQMGVKKRPHVMTAFLSRIPLCARKPDAKERTFEVHLPLDEIKATQESKLEIDFWALPEDQKKEKEGWVHLSPLLNGSGCTLGVLKWGLFPGIGPVTEGQWNDDIYVLFGERHRKSKIYMLSYRSTEDSTEAPVEDY